MYMKHVYQSTYPSVRDKEIVHIFDFTAFPTSRIL